MRARSWFDQLEVQYPESVRAGLVTASDRQRCRSLWGVTVMGAQSVVDRRPMSSAAAGDDGCIDDPDPGSDVPRLRSDPRGDDHGGAATVCRDRRGARHPNEGTLDGDNPTGIQIRVPGPGGVDAVTGPPGNCDALAVGPDRGRHSPRGRSTRRHKLRMRTWSRI